MNYWYSATDKEIFLDLDSRASLLRALKVLRVALRLGSGQCECSHWPFTEGLNISDVFHYSTGRPGHSHVIVRLEDSKSQDLRNMWALWLGSDRLRATYVFKRWRYGLEHSDLLVSTREYYRPANETCECPEKHKRDEITRSCPALALLLGEHATADYYPRVGDSKAGPLRVPLGRVSKTLLMKGWKIKNGKRQK